MAYGRMPFYPQGCGPRNELCMPLFDHGGCGCPREECQCVRIRNPACPGEYADVELCVDVQGNLSICVHRPPKPCAPRCKRHKPLYGCAQWN